MNPLNSPFGVVSSSKLSDLVAEPSIGIASINLSVPDPESLEHKVHHIKDDEKSCEEPIMKFSPFSINSAKKEVRESEQRCTSNYQEKRIRELLEDFGENTLTGSYEVAKVGDDKETRYILHKVQNSGKVKYINTKEVIATKPFKRGVTSTVHRVLKSQTTEVDGDEYVLRYAKKSKREYAKDFIVENAILKMLFEQQEKIVGLRTPSHCIVFHPGKGISCLDRKYYQSLLDFINENKSPEAHTLNSIAIQLLKGIDSLISNNIIHTDIKADNVLLLKEEKEIVVKEKNVPLLEEKDEDDEESSFDINAPLPEEKSRVIIDKIMIAHHSDLGRAVHAPNLEDLIEKHPSSYFIDIQNIADLICNSPYPGTNSVGDELDQSKEYEDAISEFDDKSKRKADYDLLKENYKGLIQLSKQRMLFSIGCLLHQLYLRVDPYPCDDSEDDECLFIESDESSTQKAVLMTAKCPEYLADLITGLLKPIQTRISLKDFSETIQNIRWGDAVIRLESTENQ